MKRAGVRARPATAHLLVAFADEPLMADAILAAGSMISAAAKHCIVAADLSLVLCDVIGWERSRIREEQCKKTSDVRRRSAQHVALHTCGSQLRAPLHTD